MALLILLATGCGPKTMEARMRDAEKLADRAAGYLDDAEKAMAALEPKQMQSALEDAKDVLARKDIELYPEAQMHLDRYRELNGKLAEVKATREKRDLEKRLNQARDKIVPRAQALLEAQEALVPGAPTRAACDTLEAKAKALKDAVDDDLDLFVKDSDFAAWARSQRNKVDKALDAAAHARVALAFLEGPVTSWREGVTLQKDAKAKKSAGDRETALREAKNRFADCAKAATPVAELKVTVDGKPMSPAQLVTVCDKALKGVEGEWKKAAAALKKPKK